MSLRERLNDDLKTAMRSKDTLRLAVIRAVKAAILQVETRGERTTLGDDAIVDVIAKEVKQRRGSLAEFERANRPDVVAQLDQEITILSEYLPEPLTQAELSALVTEAISATHAQGPQDMGRVMGWLQPHTRGRADGKAVADAVRQALR